MEEPMLCLLVVQLFQLSRLQSAFQYKPQFSHFIDWGNKTTTHRPNTNVTFLIIFWIRNTVLFLSLLFLWA